VLIFVLITPIPTQNAELSVMKWASLASPVASIKNQFDKWGLLGVNPEDFRIDSRRTVVCNQLAIATILVTQIFFWHNLLALFTTLFFLFFCSLMLGVLWLNHLKKYRTARLLFVLTILNLIYWFGVLLPVRWPETKTAFLHLQIAFASFPLLLFSLRREPWLVVGLMLYVTAQLVAFRYLDDLWNPIPPAANLSYARGMFQNHMSTVVSVLMLGLSFGFYQRMGRHAEQQGKNLLRETQKQNHQLARQDEQIQLTLRQMEVANLTLNQTLKEQAAQRAQLQHQHSEILSSISYAHRIQTALLPPDNYVKALFPHSWVFYRPRDIVSGDFYWMTATQKSIWLAVVDCTGHGVPGAFMSVMGYSLLNQIVSESPDLAPDVFLSQLDERIRHILHQQGADDESLDGMDMALCSIELRTGKLAFAGAGRPLYILGEQELHILDGERLPVGGLQYKFKAYKTKHFTLQTGDRVYLFTDGITDQFGRDEGRRRKFTPARLKDWVERQRKTSMKQQPRRFEKMFDDWQGDEDQLDDLTLFAFEWQGD